MYSEYCVGYRQTHEIRLAVYALISDLLKLSRIEFVQDPALHPPPRGFMSTMAGVHIQNSTSSSEAVAHKRMELGELGFRLPDGVL
jgi:hypothetical protein